MSTPDAPKVGFTNIEHGASDIVLAAAFNQTGTRITLGSSDHKIRVFDVDTKSKWNLVDQWRGHDAEVLDAGSLLSIVLGLAESSQGSMGRTHARADIRNHWR